MPADDGLQATTASAAITTHDDQDREWDITGKNLTRQGTRATHASPRREAILHDRAPNELFV
jgi:hypothetical protein